MFQAQLAALLEQAVALDPGLQLIPAPDALGGGTSRAVEESPRLLEYLVEPGELAVQCPHAISNVVYERVLVLQVEQFDQISVHRVCLSESVVSAIPPESVRRSQ